MFLPILYLKKIFVVCSDHLLCISVEAFNAFSLDRIGIDARKRELLEARFFESRVSFSLTHLPQVTR